MKKQLIALLLLSQIGLLNGYFVNRPNQYDVFQQQFIFQNPSQALFLEAERILQNLKISIYTHSTTINEETGQYDCDCSGLIAYIARYFLNNEDHPYYDLIDAAKTFGVTRPLAGDFYNFFNQCPTSSTTSPNEFGWQKIRYLRHVKPGDLIAWKYKDPETTSTGHVIIVADLPYKTGSIKVDGVTYWQYKIKVIDSIRTDLHYQDSRTNQYNETHEGVGTGFMYFGVNQSGEIQYWRWDYYKGTPHFDDFAIGRAVPFSTEF